MHQSIGRRRANPLPLFIVAHVCMYAWTTPNNISGHLSTMSNL